MFAFVGSQSRPEFGGIFNGDGEGVYAFKINEADGSLRLIGTVPLPDPMFLAVLPAKRVLYAGSHAVVFEGGKGGGVTAFAVAADGTLKRLNSRLIPHPHVTMVATDPGGRNLLVASSLGGAVTAVRIEDDGSLGPVTDSAQFEGEVIVKLGETPPLQPIPGLERRTGKPERAKVTITRLPRYGGTTMPHCVEVSLDGRWVLAADIGASGIGVLGFDAASGKFTSKARYPMPQPSGPRILALHPNGHTFYSVNELDSSVCVFELNLSDGSVRQVQWISALPPGIVEAKNTASGMVIDPAGKFLWATNRGHNSVSTFAVDGQGKLSYLSSVPSSGHFPVHLGMTPDHRLLYASNVFSDTLASFFIDSATGALRAGSVTQVPTACAVFLS